MSNTINESDKDRDRMKEIIKETQGERVCVYVFKAGERHKQETLRQGRK
jgi:hypothetical protein